MSNPNLIGSIQRREYRLRSDTVDLAARTVDLSFSSETPVERFWGNEILDHSFASVRLQRLQDGSPLLLQHDPNTQIGVVESARLDSDKKCRARVRFSQSQQATEILQDIADGIRSKVSVGYAIYQMVLEAQTDGVETYRITDWEPMEISIVSLPADNAVGVGRSLLLPETNHMSTNLEPETEQLPADPLPLPETRAAHSHPPQPPTAPAVINPDAEHIRTIAKHFNQRDLGEDQIMLGATVSQFRDLIRTQRADPVPTFARIEAQIPYSGSLRAFDPSLYDGGRREAEQAAYRAGQWARAMIFGDQGAMRWCRDHQINLAIATNNGMGQRALTGMSSGQAVVVPDELILPIISLREKYGLARQLSYVHPMQSDTASVPRDTGDVTAYFVGREAAPSASDPTFDNLTLVAKNVAAETRISNDYADDSVINLADFVAEKHARAFAIKEDDCWFNGDGTSAYGGIVGLRTAILSLASAVDAASGHNTFATVDAADLRSVMAKLPDLPGIAPTWLTSKPGQNLLFGRLTDAAGGNAKGDLSAKMPDQWAGYTIQTSPAMPKVTTSLINTAMVLFGDFKMGVIFGDRRGMTMMVDPYSLSSYQQTKIISSERFDINCHGVGTASNAGPIVALIGK
ncbi:phage major capsid protein [Chromatium okenii]|jgi:HK97 family phage major capsid protein/HK97 family phage prohead protease|uniref:phage major capsid protein n=1 Tax=Chromatium okenii TaxID=61644 RepID=UPI0026EE2346|nr:phage major capsid protein [Chromatium okenii]MBV5311534.1 phage major capsid protein [Chromatium okenii]